MSGPPPIPFAWDGESFTPASQYWARRCDEHYVIGETYRMVPHEERSQRSHAHYFASVNETWKNLPDDQLERFPTAEHLRKWALIRAGYREERNIVCSSKAEAQRVAAFIRPIDDYAVVIVRDAVVIQYTAKSQSTRAMDKKTFQESKEAVLNILSELIGVDAQTLQRETGRAA